MQVARVQLVKRALTATGAHLALTATRAQLAPQAVQLAHRVRAKTVLDYTNAQQQHPASAPPPTSFGDGYSCCSKHVLLPTEPLGCSCAVAGKKGDRGDPGAPGPRGAPGPVGPVGPGETASKLLFLPSASLVYIRSYVCLLSTTEHFLPSTVEQELLRRACSALLNVQLVKTPDPHTLLCCACFCQLSQTACFAAAPAATCRPTFKGSLIMVPCGAVSSAIQGADVCVSARCPQGAYLTGFSCQVRRGRPICCPVTTSCT
jgi:hypothetical protein